MLAFLNSPPAGWSTPEEDRALLLAPVAWWLTGPVMKIFGLAAQLLPDTLIEVEPTSLMAQLTAPINSISFIVGMVFLVAFRFFWKLRS